MYCSFIRHSARKRKVYNATTVIVGTEVVDQPFFFLLKHRELTKILRNSLNVRDSS